MLWTQSKKFREWLNHEPEIDMIILTESSHENLENILKLFYSGRLLLKANEVHYSNDITIKLVHYHITI